MRRLFGSLIFVALVLAEVAALAGPSDREARAARAFKDAQAAFAAGDFARAGEQFELANREKPHHAAVWNAARSWQRAGDDVRAANLLERFLKDAPADAPERDEASLALTTLGRYLARIELRGDGVTDIELDGAIVDRPVFYVKPGEHVATAKAGGAAVKRVVSVAAGELKVVRLEADPEPRDPPGRADEARLARPTPEPPLADTRRASGGLSPWFVVAGGGLTAVAAAFTIASGLDALDERDAFDADPSSQAKFDRLESAEARTNLLVGTTAGLAVVTTALAVFFVDWGAGGSRAARRSAPRVAVAPGGVWLTGAFP